VRWRPVREQISHFPLRHVCGGRPPTSIVSRSPRGTPTSVNLSLTSSSHTHTLIVDWLFLYYSELMTSRSSSSRRAFESHQPAEQQPAPALRLYTRLQSRKEVGRRRRRRKRRGTEGEERESGLRVRRGVEPLTQAGGWKRLPWKPRPDPPMSR